MTLTGKERGREEGDLARAVKTNGIGRLTTAHLNFTRSLAEAWRDEQHLAHQGRHYRLPLHWDANRVPYAGKEYRE